MMVSRLPRVALALYGAAGVCVVASAFLLAGWRAKGTERIAQDAGGAALRMSAASVAPGDPDRVRREIEVASAATLARKMRLALPGGGVWSFTPESVGFAIDDARLQAIAAELAGSGSVLRRSLEASGAVLEAPLILRGDALFSKLLEVKNSVDRRPKSARIDTKNGQVKADVVGLRFDVFRTMEAVSTAVRRGAEEVVAVVEEVPAAHLARDLADVRFDEVLGYFETHYNSDAKHEARSFNLKLAASRFDGTVLFPGETFDFNEVVGPRTEAWGYKVAPVIASGELVDGVGGGTCQIAGTLHGAAFFAGLDIIERHPHTRPSYYIKMGLDASVAYPTLTLRIRNPFEFPVVLVEAVRGGLVRAEVLGPKRTRTVTFVRKIDEAQRFEVREVPEPRLPRGQRIVSQRGVPGFDVTRFRIVREGPFAYRERLSDRYPPTSEIVRVGTGGDPADPQLHDDEHPEYVADDYLSVTQGPDIRTPNASSPERGGGTTEVRVAGRYGTKGWSAKSGAFERRRKKAVEIAAPVKRSGASKAPKGGKGTR